MAFRFFWLSLLCGYLLSACGVSDEQHQSSLDEVKNLRADLATMQQACDQQTAELRHRSLQLAEENTVMKSKLVSMGEDLSQLKTQTGQMVEDLNQKDQRIAELIRAEEAARKRSLMFRDLVAKFQRMIDAGKLKVAVRNGKMIVQMNDQILFDAGEDQLKAEGKQALIDVTRVLKDIPERHFQVAGHTDNVPIRSTYFKTNWELSAARAVNVVRFMAQNGMDPARLSAAGYGPYDPVADNGSVEGKQQNRRIEITLMPSISELPTIVNDTDSHTAAQ